MRVLPGDRQGCEAAGGGGPGGPGSKNPAEEPWPGGFGGLEVAGEVFETVVEGVTAVFTLLGSSSASWKASPRLTNRFDCCSASSKACSGCNIRTFTANGAIAPVRASLEGG